MQAATASRDAKGRDEPPRAAGGRDVAAKCRNEPPRAAIWPPKAAMWPPKAAMSCRGPRCGSRRRPRQAAEGRDVAAEGRAAIVFGLDRSTQPARTSAHSGLFLDIFSYIPSRKLSWIRTRACDYIAHKESKSFHLSVLLFENATHGQ